MRLFQNLDTQELHPLRNNCPKLLKLKLNVIIIDGIVEINTCVKVIYQILNTMAPISAASYGSSIVVAKNTSYSHLMIWPSKHKLVNMTTVFARLPLIGFVTYEIGRCCLLHGPIK